ncbi:MULTISPECIES: TOBE domain-containing protein [Methanobrevibacter]|uniref:TOBE domain-containing protein n=1 Tax=Methanobrevibacter TaxID=2172 RepID=UPI0025ED22B6|nr:MULTISPECIES: TOBE domain-containing protein [Methanobrevibacter]MCI7428827.1 TOBE domain-containing protein [Methanobrevibacter sp.]MDD6776475.1 TOBE domain-containing protein [Methanobacteriaceae archaeon]MDY3096754.1 TOBE domain-containing protein [Methanobrevibacter sp.]
MADVKAGVEYKINVNNNLFLLDNKKYQLLQSILDYGSLTKAAKEIKVSYRTALNYIEKMEMALDVKIVNTTKGGKGGGGGTSLTDDGYSILKECKKINAIMELHKDVNEIEAEIVDVNLEKGVMTIKMNQFEINAPLNRNYELGDKILALISYDNIFLMLEPQSSSIRNVLKGQIVEMRLKNEIIRVKIDVGGVVLCSDITVSAEKELNLNIGSEVYVGFKAMSVATLKL